MLYFESYQLSTAIETRIEKIWVLHQRVKMETKWDKCWHTVGILGYTIIVYNIENVAFEILYKMLKYIFLVEMTFDFSFTFNSDSVKFTFS